jgi:hypothetical protein
MGDYGGGNPSRSPFWRTPEESCKGLGSMSFENKHSTHTHTSGADPGRKRGKSGKKRKKRQQLLLGRAINLGGLQRLVSRGPLLARELHLITPRGIAREWKTIRVTVCFETGDQIQKIRP